MALQFQPNYLTNLLGNQPAAPAAISGWGSDLGIAPQAIPENIAPAANSPVQAPPQAGRRSALDIIGGLGDTFARAGGAEAQYQPQVDARAEHARQIDIDEMRKQQFAQQQRRGDQEYQAGELGIADEHRKVLGQATRGLAAIFQKHGPEGLTKAWPVLAQQLQIPPEQAQLFGQALAADPEGTLQGLNEALNPPPQHGSEAKEVELYKVAKAENPNLTFKEFLDDYQTHPMSPYQSWQANWAENPKNPRNRSVDWATDPRNPRNQPKPGKEAPGGGAASVSDLRNVLGTMRQNYAALKQSGAIVQQGGDPKANVTARLRASGVGQLVEGAVGTQAQTYRDNITNSRPALIQAVMKATGMSSKQMDSNTELKLMLSTATDPTQSYESNQAALARLETFVQNHGGAAAPAKPRIPGKLAPRPAANNGGWKVIGVK